MNTEERKIRARSWQKIRRDKKKEWLRSIKIERGCVDCGMNDFRALQFDHVADKSFTISLRFDLSKEKLLEEIKKCEVRCANCHHIKTWERQH